MKAKHYKMNDWRAKIHKNIFIFFVKRGMHDKKAYKIASAITNWR